jgi:hypothetical protein
MLLRSSRLRIARRFERSFQNAPRIDHKEYA